MHELKSDFLTPQEFSPIRDYFMGPHIQWYYNPFVDYDGVFSSLDLDDYQFIHKFTGDEEILKPLISKINPSKILRIKANCNPRTPKNIPHKFHVDVGEKCKTSIFYINTNDGWTEFENGATVESVENTLLTFDSQIKHTGTTCTDQKIRVLINLNYYA